MVIPTDQCAQDFGNIWPWVKKKSPRTTGLNPFFLLPSFFGCLFLTHSYISVVPDPACCLIEVFAKKWKDWTFRKMREGINFDQTLNAPFYFDIERLESCPFKAWPLHCDPNRMFDAVQHQTGCSAVQISYMLLCFLIRVDPSELSLSMHVNVIGAKSNCKQGCLLLLWGWVILLVWAYKADVLGAPVPSVAFVQSRVVFSFTTLLIGMGACKRCGQNDQGHHWLTQKVHEVLLLWGPFGLRKGNSWSYSTCHGSENGVNVLSSEN